MAGFTGVGSAGVIGTGPGDLLRFVVDFHQAHPRTAAVRAGLHGGLVLRCGGGGCGLGGLGGRVPGWGARAQQRPCLCEAFLAPAVGEQAVVPDFDKALALIGIQWI